MLLFAFAMGDVMEAIRLNFLTVVLLFWVDTWCVVMTSKLKATFDAWIGELLVINT